MDKLEQRSEGELMDLDASQESIGEVMRQGSNIVGKPIEPKQSKQRYGAQSKPQFSLSNKKEGRPIGNYEGGGERTISAYD